MTHDPLTDEVGRLASLHRYSVLDSPPEVPFDKITQLVKTVLSVPIAAVSLIDADRQWFKSCVGIEVRETARDISFCTHTIKSRDPMVIGDATRDPKFAHNPLVLGPPYIASYAGAPLLTPEGYALGSLCAIDTVPRQFADWQIDVLKSFAALVVDEFELRRLSQTDSATGVLNRRALLVEAGRAVSHFSRSGFPSSIINFGIGDFGRGHNSHGAAAHDAIMRACAGLINEQSRPGDILARTGDNEFMLLLTGTNLEQATLAAERCRVALAALTFAHDPQQQIMTSFGIAALTSDCASPEKWLAAAEHARHAAEQEGGHGPLMHATTPQEADDDVYVLQQADVIHDGAEAGGHFDAEFERYKNSVEPLSRALWLRLRRSRHLKEAKTGRLAYGGLTPGMVNCEILELHETGMRVETSAKFSAVPELFSLEFCGIYCRARTAKLDEGKIGLEFIFDEA